MKSTIALIALLLLGPGIPAISRADVVTDWNQNMQAAAFAANTSPVVTTRVAAIVQSAVFDAVNGIEQRYSPVHVDFAAPKGASRRAAVIQAAYATLVTLYPSQKSDLDAKRAASLASIVDDPSDVEDSVSVARGIAWGQTVANDIMAWRSTDGFSSPIDFVGGLAVGQWRPTLPAFAHGAVPQLANVTPWAIASPSQFLPPGPPALGSAQYAADYNQTKDVGSLTSGTRTADQTDAAIFWASNTIFFDRIALAMSAQRHTNLSGNARLFALIAIAQADAAIACWNAKYTYTFWRPITAIQLGDTDGNANTILDAACLPLIPTPAFPEYPSGHATVSPAAAVVLTAFFGHSGSFVVTGNGTNIVRSFTSFAAASDEAFFARIWGGIHFFTACQDGHTLGTAVGNYVLSHALLPLNGRKIGTTTHNHGGGTVSGDGEIAGEDGF
jgi:hypothetical protein